MNFPAFHQRLIRLALCLLLPIMAGCAFDRGYRAGMEHIANGNYEEGLALISRATEDDPRNPTYRAAYLQQRDQAITRLLVQADREVAARQLDAADLTYQRVLQLDRDNARASDGIRSLQQIRAVASLVESAEAAVKSNDFERAERFLNQALALDPRNQPGLSLRSQIDATHVQTRVTPPRLKPLNQSPINLEFREANIRYIFEMLSRTTGLNFVIDKDVKTDQKATLFVRQVHVEDAIDLILLQGQLDKKIINENTMIIFPANAGKQKDYQDLAIRTFVLANADARQVLQLFKTLLRIKDVYIDEKLNAISIRDTPDVIRLAERLIGIHDQADPEVVLEIEVLEIARKRLMDLGIQWPNTFTSLNTNLGAITLLNQLRGIDSGRIGINGGPVARINASDNEINTLANPLIRVRSKEKARIHIGDKIPIVSTTSTPSTQGPVTTENITYLDIGLKIEVEPTVYANDDVGIRISLEASNSTSRGTTASGSTLVEVSTRNAGTVLRLKDGETQVLAGLIRNDYGNSGNRIPGLGDIPGIGRLFGSAQDSSAKTELILSIRPRIVRNVATVSPLRGEYSSGTETTIRAPGLQPRGPKGSPPDESSRFPKQSFIGPAGNFSGESPRSGSEAFAKNAM